MKLVCTRFRDDVHNCSAGPPIFRGVSVRIDLKLLHRILAELKWCAAGTGSAGSLAEESIVVVRSIDDEAVECPSLSGKTDVSGTNIAGDTWRQQNEIDETAAVHRQIRDSTFVDRRT